MVVEYNSNEPEAYLRLTKLKLPYTGLKSEVLCGQRKYTMPRLRPTVSDETYELIQQHAKTNDLSMSAATWEFIEAGAKALYGVEPESPAPHGDVSRIKRMAEYKQCQQCGGWNIGIYEDKRICADCGWTPDD